MLIRRLFKSNSFILALLLCGFEASFAKAPVINLAANYKPKGKVIKVSKKVLTEQDRKVSIPGIITATFSSTDAKAGHEVRIYQVKNDDTVTRGKDLQRTLEIKEFSDFDIVVAIFPKRPLRDSDFKQKIEVEMNVPPKFISKEDDDTSCVAYQVKEDDMDSIFYLPYQSNFDLLKKTVSFNFPGNSDLEFFLVDSKKYVSIFRIGLAKTFEGPSSEVESQSSPLKKSK